SGDYIPMLATSWEFTDHGNTLRLHLHKDVTFSDGTPFDASAVKANIHRYKTTPNSKDAASIVKSVEVISPHVVDLDLARPSRDILNALAQPVVGIMVSPKALDNPDLGTRPVGTGAWTIKS